MPEQLAMTATDPREATLIFEHTRAAVALTTAILAAMTLAVIAAGALGVILTLLGAGCGAAFVLYRHAHHPRRRQQL